jgi:hypothetical protein
VERVVRLQVLGAGLRVVEVQVEPSV